MFKKLRKNEKGFTLAELLIVVAIIGVLVAISIPIFTSQLEKAREATDQANLRSLYAECASSALTGTASSKNVTITTKDGVTTATGEYTLVQEKDGWVDGKDVTIGGIEVKSAEITKGATYTVTVTSDGETATISKKS